MLDDMIKVLQIIYFVVSIAWIVAQSHDKDKDKDKDKDEKKDN
ncbi:hypothetical protein ACO11K_004388 [Bacillus cytotoxicus]